MTTDILKACPLFAGFSEAGLLMMSKIASIRTIPKQTPIFVENMVAESLFVVQNGVVELQLKSPDGRDRALEKLAPGDAFGELSLLIGGHRMVSAMAATDCELIEITRKDFLKLQRTKPQACLKLMINIAALFGKRLQGCREYLKPTILAGLQD